VGGKGKWKRKQTGIKKRESSKKSYGFRNRYHIAAGVVGGRIRVCNPQHTVAADVKEQLFMSPGGNIAIPGVKQTRRRLRQRIHYMY
jgi:hypothetical protein